MRLYILHAVARTTDTTKLSRKDAEYVTESPNERRGVTMGTEDLKDTEEEADLLTLLPVVWSRLQFAYRARSIIRFAVSFSCSYLLSKSIFMFLVMQKRFDALKEYILVVLLFFTYLFALQGLRSVINIGERRFRDGSKLCTCCYCPIFGD
jgi:hypothetical protein